MIIKRCGNAITVVNALITGIGSTIGIKAENVVTIIKSDDLEIVTKPSQNPSDLVISCIKHFSNYCNIVVEKVKILTSSSFPPEKGLKTSSAISTLLILALAEFYNIKLTTEESVNLAADASVEIGVSITGALDDAYASIEGGHFITNNIERKIIFRSKFENFKDVILMIPSSKMSKNEIRLENKEKYRDQINRALKLSEKGDVFSAIKINTSTYFSLLYSKNKILDRLESDLVGIIGLNGTGPSLFLISEPINIDANLKVLEQNYPEFEIIQTKFS